MEQRGPLARMLDVDTMLDFVRVEANARRFVSRIERVASANHPPTPDQWAAARPSITSAAAGGKTKTCWCSSTTTCGSPTSDASNRSSPATRGGRRFSR
ncbi:hypothetical protein ACU686_07720 [Yinghuangia aomiensis]